MSRMDIKATGAVVADRGDGRVVEVEWDTELKPKSWYFYTGRATIWKLRTDRNYRLHELSKKKLIDFAGKAKTRIMDISVICGGSQGRAWARPTGSEARDINASTLGVNPYGIEDIHHHGCLSQ